MIIKNNYEKYSLETELFQLYNYKTKGNIYIILKNYGDYIFNKKKTILLEDNEIYSKEEIIEKILNDINQNCDIIKDKSYFVLLIMIDILKNQINKLIKFLIFIKHKEYFNTNYFILNFFNKIFDIYNRKNVENTLYLNNKKLSDKNYKKLFKQIFKQLKILFKYYMNEILDKNFIKTCLFEENFNFEKYYNNLNNHNNLFIYFIFMLRCSFKKLISWDEDLYIYLISN